MNTLFFFNDNIEYNTIYLYSPNNLNLITFDKNGIFVFGDVDYKYPIKKGSYKTYKFKDNIIYGDNEILFTFPKINKMYLRITNDGEIQCIDYDYDYDYDDYTNKVISTIAFKN